MSDYREESWLLQCTACHRQYKTTLPTMHMLEKKVHFGFGDDGEPRDDGIESMMERVVAKWPNDDQKVCGRPDCPATKKKQGLKS